MTQPKDEKPLGKPKTAHNDTSPVSSYGLLYITRVHNQGELTSEEWLRAAITGAEARLQQHAQREPPATD